MTTSAATTLSSDPLDLDRLYREHGDAVLRRARRFLRSEDDARDVVQDVFLDVCRRPARFEARSSIATYLFSAATHACLNRIRDGRTRTRLLAIEGAGLERLAPARGETRAIASEILGSLSEEEAALAVYLYCDELTHDEVAALLGCSRRHVGDLAAKLRARIQARVEPKRSPVASAALTAGVACAAAIVAVLVWPRTQPAPEVRTKGGPILGFFVAHGDQVRRGARGEAVVPGDRIELFTTTTESLWFAALSVDAATGARDIYATPSRIEPGQERAMPMSIELDATLGAETVNGVFCAETFDVRTIDLNSPPRGCTVERITLVVEPR